ncbi:hypothetical protein JHJ32_01455 [Parapedobacter sp. ISTM3]|uniref:Uncharacterized protein n=1 Tax=Parapedobacter luteus TaxID=623280 RepID=A0A1T4ZTZ4_9SPHI|nr:MULTISPECIES: glycosyltransferase family 4 protein [Parapedobacter]MBK1438642.1 hypothetical protein [Parapedobacter sp. ISTM3]SKB26222.1 hypothetical protein SAMN05660226_00088 [Parapedobacter luteus]
MNDEQHTIRIALVEIGGSHDECLYSQCLFLQGHAHVTLVVTADLEARLGDYHWMASSTKVFGFHSSASFQWKNIWKVYRYLKSQRFDRIVFNTAQGGLKKLFVLPFPEKTVMLGVIHNTSKFYTGIGQKLINRRVKRYFVLNDYLLPSVSRLTGLRFASYYPIFFPEWASADTIQKPDGALWIGIPGEVSSKRRDYAVLLDTLKAWKEKRDVKFILLGRLSAGDRNWIIKQLNDHPDLSAHIIYFEQFVPIATLHAYMRLCDAVMPLIHPCTQGFSDYLNHKISGAFNLAFAYRKPLIIEQSFSAIQDLCENAVFYAGSELKDTFFTQLMAVLPKIKEGAYRHAKWAFNAQQQAYLAFTEVRP